MRVAVMQPYFYPYLGYYQLLASVDLFLIFDCVQFPRRGRVHRAPLPGENRWLTLPLARQARETRIDEVEFSAAAEALWRARLDQVEWLSRAPELRAALAPLQSRRLVDFLEKHLRLACRSLGITTRLQRSSSYSIAPGLRSQKRVLALAQAVGASEYVNLPGGRGLYDPAAFAAAGLKLSFLPDYDGPFLSMLHAFACEPRSRLRQALAALPPPRPAREEAA